MSFEVPAGELRFRVSRSSGPGGQHVNKTATRVEAIWDLATSPALDDVQRARLLEKLASKLNKAGELIVACESERSQRRNRELAVERLQELVRAALRRPRPRRRGGVPTAAKRKRVESKKQRGQVKQQRRSPETE